MWFEHHSNGRWNEAISHLGRDPRMREAIKRVGPCALEPRKDYFVVLAKAIFSQQISTAAAASVFGRFRDLFPARRPTPKLVLEAYARDAECLRRCGLSRQKHAYVLDLAERFATNQIPTRRLAAMSDEEVIATLTAVKGIGRWTAEMFLIFTLNRPDVWPVDDLGLRQGAQVLLKLKKTPDAKTLNQLGEQWRPYRSVATWYIWRNLTATRNASSRRAAPAAKK